MKVDNGAKHRDEADELRCAAQNVIVRWALVDSATGVVVDPLEGQFKYRNRHRIGTHQRKGRPDHRDRRGGCHREKRGGGTAKADQIDPASCDGCWYRGWRRCHDVSPTCLAWVDHSKRAEMGRNAETIAAER